MNDVVEKNDKTQEHKVFVPNESFLRALKLLEEDVRLQEEQSRRQFEAMQRWID